MANPVLRLTKEEVENYLALIRSGHGLTESARRMGLPPAGVIAARKLNPEFEEAVQAAEIEAAEPVETVLYEAAKRGEPWAVQQWLKHRSPARWSAPDVTVNVKHELGPESGAALERIAALQERLEARQAALPAGPAVLDAESRPAGRPGG